jgi:hypothetical protein
VGLAIDSGAIQHCALTKVEIAAAQFRTGAKPGLVDEAVAVPGIKRHDRSRPLDGARLEIERNKRADAVVAAQAVAFAAFLSLHHFLGGGVVVTGRDVNHAALVIDRRCAASDGAARVSLGRHLRLPDHLAGLQSDSRHASDERAAFVLWIGRLMLFVRRCADIDDAVITDRRLRQDRRGCLSSITFQRRSPVSGFRPNRSELPCLAPKLCGCCAPTRTPSANTSVVRDTESASPCIPKPCATRRPVRFGH